ncbi:carbon catabolite repressor protein 4 homolog 4 [Silene latifolia]|uniref:carbon catabolite repressor protein 4 homolog 4 n=1 Tax=Silene latifolia TaxID=37657 RepID=UPI003D77F583
MLRTLPLLPRFSITVSRRMSLATMSTQAPPICPAFVPVEQSEITSISSSEGYKFSVVSYNILAQVYVKSSLFPHSPKPCLRWKARSQAVLTVLENLGADFLCLQELDEYDDFYRGNIERHGYSSIYIQRNGQKRDGCGIFYKPSSAELVLQENIEYNDLVKSIVEDDDSSDKSEKQTHDECTKEDRGDPNDPRVRLKRDCVGIMSAFRLADASRHLLIIANTHIYWDPEWADVKLAQVKYLLSRLDQFRILVSERFECTPSVIVTGDFNSTPGSEVYNYLISGSSGGQHTVECPDKLPIPLSSFYGCSRGEPPFTNCTPGFTGTLDYIFFTPSGSIKPVRFLELPDSDSPSVEGGLPNYQHPSDHLPIGAEFEVIEK